MPSWDPAEYDAVENTYWEQERAYERELWDDQVRHWEQLERERVEEHE